MPGAVILDTNAIKWLETEGARQRLRASLRAADLALWPSALNALEAVATENPRVRVRLLDTLRELSPSQHLLPLPTDLLRRVGESILAGDGGFVTPESGLEWLVHEPERITDEQVPQAGEIAAHSQHVWDEGHRKARRRVREILRAEGRRDPWGDVPSFLEQVWMRPQQLDTFIEGMWREMNLPAPAPLAALLENEAWRLYLEGFGATVYEHCVPSQVPKPAHVADVVQLVYLAGASRRVFVTEEKPLTRVAMAVLPRRHALSRVMHPRDLLAAA